MSMGFMVAAAASRKRDDRGRYMESPDRRMDGGYERPMGNYSRMDEGPEMRRRRDSRGRYMEDEGGSRMEYDGNRGNYARMEQGGNSANYWPEPHIPPYGDEPEMRENDGHRMAQRRIGFGANHAEGDDMNYPDRMGDEPEMRRRRDSRGRYMDDDHRQPEMRQGNVSYFPRMHHGGSTGDGQKVEAGGTFWMIPPKHEKMTREKAEKWVRKMHGDDPKVHGEMWSYEDAKKLAEERGLPIEGQEMVDFYVTLNMVYTDFCKVANEHGVDTEDYFADLAVAWLYDRDGKPPTEKLMAYKKYVVPHKEE